MTIDPKCVSSLFILLDCVSSPFALYPSEILEAPNFFLFDNTASAIISVVLCELDITFSVLNGLSASSRLVSCLC